MPETIPVFAGSGVHDLIVRVDPTRMLQGGYTPLDCFDLTVPQVVGGDRGSGVLVESRIAETVAATAGSRVGIELRVVVDTRWLALRSFGDADLRVDVSFPFTAAFQRVLDCFLARRSAGERQLLVSCLATSLPLDVLGEVRHERLNPEEEGAQRAYFVLLGQKEVPAELQSKQVRREPQEHPGALSLLVLRVCGLQRTGPSVLEVGLALDLGNTRSSALVVDDIQGREGARWELRRLSVVDYITWDGHGTGRPQPPDAGVFDSVLTLVSPSRFESSTLTALGRAGLPLGSAYGQPLSFVRMGQGAAPLQRSLLSDPAPGRHALSSPKRYFWEDDPEPTGWKAFTPRDGSAGKPLGDGRPLTEDAPLVRRLAVLEQHEARRLSRSAVLSTTVAELLEQAEGMMNHPVTLMRSETRSRRLITALCVTHPPGWSTAERDLYRSRICRGVEGFCSLRALPLPEVYVECDEASAALLGYLYSELRKFGLQAQTWLSLIGRWVDGAPRVRIATLDLGGGTSDLVVTEVSATAEGAAVEIVLKRLHRDGLNTAGDEMLRRVVEAIVLPELGRRLFPNSEAWKAAFNELLVTAAADDHLRSWRNRWAREIWFPLAVKMLQAIAAGKGSFPLGELDSRIFDFQGENGLLWGAVQRLRLDTAFFRWKSTEGSPSFAVPKDADSVLARVCDEVFEGTARRFAASITALDCDIVITAGKTSEIPYVSEIFRRHTPMPRDRFVTLQGYYTGRWCPLADPQGRIADAKITTVLGAAVFLMSRQHSPALEANLRVVVGDAPVLAEENHYWGIVNSRNLRFSNQSLLFGPGKARKAIVSLSAGSVLIGRRPHEWEVQEAQIAYELRLRPRFRDYGAPDGARVELEWVPKGPSNVELALSSVLDGRFRNGMPLRLEHIELRPRTLAAEGFWVDDGVVVSRPFG